eukprot:SAG31_NODE_16_length_36206_cov_27.355728_31_plen_82_part_00
MAYSAAAAPAENTGHADVGEVNAAEELASHARLAMTAGDTKRAEALYKDAIGRLLKVNDCANLVRLLYCFPVSSAGHRKTI